MSEGLFQDRIFKARKFQLRVAAPTVFWLASTLSTSGCLFQKKPRAYVPPPVHPPAPVALKPVPLLIDPVPAVEVAAVELPDLGLNNLPDFPPPVKPPPPPVRVKPTPVMPPKPQTAQAEPPAPTLPHIQQMLTTDQQSAYRREIDDVLGRVPETLKTAGKRNLSADQRDQVEKITNFLKQAVQAREEDLVTAVAYARRADNLAKDLLAHLP